MRVLPIELLSTWPKSALVVAHPGHELRVHGWLEGVRPTVFVLTDGSGSGSQSRLSSTTRVLERAGARAGDIYGVFTDRELYAAILGGRTFVFEELANQLLDALITEGIRVVASDALEGFNPAHDLCRHLVDAVVARAHIEGYPMTSFEFPLERASGLTDGSPVTGAIDIEHSEESFARKIAAAQTYVGMEGEVRRALAMHGADAFRREVLWPAGSILSADPPAYESYGEKRRANGIYDEVIRRRQHMEPLATALRQFTRQRNPAMTIRESDAIT